MPTENNLRDFVIFAKSLRGNEKGEGQIFIDRFFRAFGHGGIIESNGILEAAIKSSKSTKFADAIWLPEGRNGVLIEMKKRGTKNLEGAYGQAYSYWNDLNLNKLGFKANSVKPRYIVLCDFNKFIIYDVMVSQEIVDEMTIDELVDRASAFNFMLPENKEPHFKYNSEKVSRETATDIGKIFKKLVFENRQDREKVQHFLLQCVLCMFSEDIGLLPKGLFSELVSECMSGKSTYDLFGNLFLQMASRERAHAGQFKEVEYFNGGLFKKVHRIELDGECLSLLHEATKHNWKEVNPTIFGALFEGTMDEKERHKFGAHFTSEQDIMKIVEPTIIRPWKEKIAKASTLHELVDLRLRLSKYKVLDPACGCGNFLYVAYRSIKELEIQILQKIIENFPSTRNIHSFTMTNTRQMYGMDIQSTAVEISKVTLLLGRELAAAEWNKRIVQNVPTLGLSYDQGLPLDNLDENIICDDALFCDWPRFDAVIGNPPFISKNKMQQELGREYLNRLFTAYGKNDARKDGIPGHADYCVYWFKKTHMLLQKNQRAGLVGTNTIRQNYSREGGLDYIVNNGGTITEAVSTQKWSGEAAVYVSIVNWVKGEYRGPKTLKIMTDNVAQANDVEVINSSLSLTMNLSAAQRIKTNAKSGTCREGIAHGNPEFLIPAPEAKALLAADSGYSDVLLPYMIGNDLLSDAGVPSRYLIDFHDKSIFEANKYPKLFNIIKKPVYEARKKRAEQQERENSLALERNPRARTNKHHINFFKYWWRPKYDRGEMIAQISKLSRYLVCVRHTQRPIFEFIDTHIRPNDSLQIFALPDDYSFGIVSSDVHWEWFVARCSTVGQTPRYTSTTVFNTFPWPQRPTNRQIKNVALFSKELRDTRNKVMKENGIGLRNLYRLMETTADNAVSKVQDKLDASVRAAYGMNKDDDILTYLLDLNLELAAKEKEGITILGPGLPPFIRDEMPYVSHDCRRMTE